MHRLKLLALHQVPDIPHDLTRVVLRYEGAPPSADALGSVDKRHWNDWQVVIGLDALALLFEIGQYSVVSLMEDGSGHGTQRCENVPGACRVLAAHDSGSELADWQEKADIVGSYEVLRHRNYRLLK